MVIGGGVGLALGVGLVSMLFPMAASAPAPPPPALTASAATSALTTIPVKGRGPMTGYTRDKFGIAWTDNNNVAGGHNQCDTRDDILAAQMTDVRKSGRCIVIGGTLADPYTGKVIPFTRGTCTSGQTVGCSNNIQIDHVVALANAWVSGAARLSIATRTDLANDPDNLQAIDGPTNAAKGDGDAATWLPPQTGYRCTYVERQVRVKVKYKLSMTQAEHDAIATILKGCP